MLARTLAGRVQSLRDQLQMLDRLQLERSSLGGLLKQLAWLLDYLTKEDRRHMWLILGIADYVRFFKYEPGKLPPLDSSMIQYNANSKATAAFLAFLTEKYDNAIVRKLNQLLRAGKYQDEAFRDLTGKTLPQLNEEWRASLIPKGKS